MHLKMPSKIIRTPLLRTVVKRAYAVQAATQADPSQGTSSFILPKQPLKTTTLPNGMIVASVETYSPVSQVAILFRAASRNETSENMGVSHALRRCTGMGTKGKSFFGITRNIQQLGGSLSCTAGREHIMYTLECLRTGIDSGLPFLSEVASKQVFKPWEMADVIPKLKLDLALIDPQVKVLDALHTVAFRTGVGNPLYTPACMIGKHNQDMLHSFVKQHFTTRCSAVVGLGMDHDKLLAYANELELESGGKTATPSKYFGGDDRYISSDNLTFVAIGTEGAAINGKDSAPLAILQRILGIGPSIKRGNAASSRLFKAVAGATENPFAVSALNYNYTDTGLFGAYVVGHSSCMNKIVRAVVEVLKNALVTDAEVGQAKSQLKAAVHMAEESSRDILEEIGLQALLTGRVANADDLTKAIDKVSTADVNAAAKKIASRKFSMASVGKFSVVPYLDHL